MKIKHFFGIIGVAALTLTACDNESLATSTEGSLITSQIGSNSTTNTGDNTPTTNTADTTPSTNTGDNTSTTNIADTTPSTNTGDNTSTTNTGDSTPTTTTDDNSDNDNTNKRNKPSDLSKTSTLYIVGDSTVDEFLNADGSVKDSTYFYERCGWGGHIKDFTENLTIVNYGASGRSSKDYLSTSYYSTILSNIKAGDYLMIGFGHNDEKSDDDTRFTDASKSITDPTSFKYSLYENYIKKAEEKGATAILCTPIVRLAPNGDYSGANGHITSTGDYRKAIVELGEEKNVKVIDLTTYTKNLYTTIGFDEAQYFHAMTSGNSATEPNLSTVDKTHINNYGAKYFDYYIAKELYDDANCYLGNYVKDEITMPTKENDLKVNSKYTYSPYSAPNLSTYSAPAHLSTITEGWYGTAFGDAGGDPNSSSNGYIAKETSAGVFQVGQSKDSATYYKGKISNSAEGIAFAFKQISINDDFEFSVDAKVLKVNGDSKQDGFGIMLRDACWLPANDKSLLSNYVAAGIYRDSGSSVSANFSRASLTEIKTSGNTVSYPAVGDTVKFKITRTGQNVMCETIIGDTTYSTQYLDFDFVAKDSEYMYIGMFGARGTVVEFTNVNYTKTGTSQGA